MNNTSTRSPESFKVILDTIMNSSSPLYIRNQKILICMAPGLCSQKINTSITLEYLASTEMEGANKIKSMILFYKRGFNFSTTSSRITSFFRLIKIEGAANDDYNVLIALMDGVVK